MEPLRILLLGIDKWADMWATSGAACHVEAYGGSYLPENRLSLENCKFSAIYRELAQTVIVM
jgi:hypothetical protein